MAQREAFGSALDLESKHVNKLLSPIDLDEDPAMAKRSAVTSCETATPSEAEPTATPGVSSPSQPGMTDPGHDHAAPAPISAPVEQIADVSATQPVLETAIGNPPTLPETDADTTKTDDDSATAQPDTTDPSPTQAADAQTITSVDEITVAPTTGPLPEPTSTSRAKPPAIDPDATTSPPQVVAGSDSAPAPERRSIRAGDRTSPRVPSKFAIFAEGDHVVYPTHGVGRVAKVGTEEIAGGTLELIHITFEENKMTLRVPISKARSTGLRKLATRKQFDGVLAVLKGRARISRTMWARRALEYQAKINSGDPLATAEVVRDLYRKPGKDEPSFSERQIYEAALDRLAGELAALDETDRSAAVAKITNWLHSASAPSPPSAV
jgi:CarD family transcriptional regulator